MYNRRKFKKMAEEYFDVEELMTLSDEELDMGEY